MEDMSLQILRIINVCLAFFVIPYAIYLLRVVLVERTNPIKTLKEYHPMNVLLRFIFLLVALIGIINGILTLLVLFDVFIPRGFYSGRDLLVNGLLFIGTWSLYRIYKRL